jgi:hypothetical protein
MTHSHCQKCSQLISTRRSKRVQDKKLKDEKWERILNLIRSGKDEGVAEIQMGGNLGRGVVVTQSFAKGDFVVEYAGEYIDSEKTFKTRMAEHDRAGRFGSFVFYLRHHEAWRW